MSICVNAGFDVRTSKSSVVDDVCFIILYLSFSQQTKAIAIIAMFLPVITRHSTEDDSCVYYI